MAPLAWRSDDLPRSRSTLPPKVGARIPPLRVHGCLSLICHSEACNPDDRAEQAYSEHRVSEPSLEWRTKHSQKTGSGSLGGCLGGVVACQRCCSATQKACSNVGTSAVTLKQALAPDGRSTPPLPPQRARGEGLETSKVKVGSRNLAQHQWRAGLKRRRRMKQRWLEASTSVHNGTN